MTARFAPDLIRGEAGGQNKKDLTYPTLHKPTYTQAMSPAPAPRITRSALDPRRAIGLFLARLFAFLVRLQASSQTVAPKDIAYMVGSAEAMVNSFIRTLAIKQLKKIGYTSAARALRNPDGLRRAAAAQAESAPATTAELIERLQTTIETFQRADAVASLIARMIVCVLALAFPEMRERPVHACNHAEHGIEHCSNCYCVIVIGR